MSNIVAILNDDKTVTLVGKQGTTWELFLILRNHDTSFMNITGFVFKGQARPSYIAAGASLTFVCEVISGLEGKLRVFASDLATSKIVAYKECVNMSNLAAYRGVGVYVYDIEMVDLSGVVTRILEGMLYVDPQVTKVKT